MNINSNSEQKVDLDYILDKGVADYSDGDIVIFEQIGDKSLNGSVKLDMIMLAYCVKGRMQVDVNGKTYTAKAGEVMIGLPNNVFSNYMISPDFESKIFGLSYAAAERNMRINRDVLDLIGYVATNPVISLDDERQALITKYYSIIVHKIKSPHGYFHKEIMHSLFQCAIYELFAIIAPHVQYSHGGGETKQANLLFRKFADLLSANEGKVRSVKRYADELCITPKYLSFVSKTVTGKTALEWIHQSTVKNIERYLSHSPTEYRRQQSMKNKTV